MLLNYFIFTVVTSLIVYISFNDISFSLDNSIFNSTQSRVYRAISYLHSFISPETPETDSYSQNDLLLTRDELSKFDGTNGNLIYLSILGSIFDVSRGKKYYAPGERYHGFAGKDATKAFITGDFSTKGLVDDINGLSHQELRGLQDWLNHYHRDYIYKGKLIGRYFDEDGNPTQYMKTVELKFREANREQLLAEEYKTLFPPCNIEWNPDTGSRVWCTKQSGGVKRDWDGVPRKFFQPGMTTFRCACVNPQTLRENRHLGNIEEYPDCGKQSSSCQVIES